MGNRLSSDFCRRKPIQVLILGLNAAGKTSLLFQYAYGSVSPSIPSTIHGNITETCKLNRKEIELLDVGIRCSGRVFLRNYYPNVKGIIFVIDGTDRERLNWAKELLEEFLNEDGLRDVPIAIALNKTDLNDCMTKEELEGKLEIASIQKLRPCRVFLTTAFPESKEGEVQKDLLTLLEWIDDEMTNKSRNRLKKKRLVFPTFGIL